MKSSCWIVKSSDGLGDLTIDTIREYLTGFANADGGLIIFGLDEETWKIESRKAPGGSDFGDWATKCLSDIFALFSPLPRFQELEHRDGIIYIAGVGRSETLISCRQSNGLAYFLRIHNQTRRAPDYLISDLILGRRQNPVLHISLATLDYINIYHSSDRQTTEAEVGLRLQIENLSLLWASNVHVGVIRYSKHSAAHVLGQHLLSYIDVEAVKEQAVSSEFRPYHYSYDIGDIQPLEVKRETLKEAIHIPLKIRFNHWFSYQWKAVVYLLAKGGAPSWYQVEIEIGQLFLEAGQENRPANHLLSVVQVIDKRPLVALQDI